MAGGLTTVGVGNVVAAAVLGPQVVYLAMAVSPVLIGSGSSWRPRSGPDHLRQRIARLPATAAALNEASVLVGGRLGLAALTAPVT